MTTKHPERPRPYLAHGLRIKTLREARGLSQAELARKAEIRNSMLCRYERGTVCLGRTNAKKLAAVLGVENYRELLPD